MKKYNHRIVYWGGVDNTIIPKAANACGTGTCGAGSISAGSGQAEPQEPQAGAEGSTLDKIKAALPILAAGALALAAIGGAIAVLKKKPPKVKPTIEGPPKDPPDRNTPKLSDVMGGDIIFANTPSILIRTETSSRPASTWTSENKTWSEITSSSFIILSSFSPVLKYKTFPGSGLRRRRQCLCLPATLAGNWNN